MAALSANPIRLDCAGLGAWSVIERGLGEGTVQKSNFRWERELSK